MSLLVAPTPASSPDVPLEASRRDRKKNATRRALREAALQLVAERGFAHVTVEDIAQAADVATRTFFNYFPSKESAVIGADPERIAAIRQSLLARPKQESCLQALRVVLVEYAATIAEEMNDLGEGRATWFRRFCVVREDPGLRGAYSAYVAEIERILTSAIAERCSTDAERDPYPALVTAAALTASRVAAFYWSANGGSESLADLTGATIDNLASGLSQVAPTAKSRTKTLQRGSSR